MIPDSLMRVFSAMLTWQIVQKFSKKQASLNLQPNAFYFFKNNMALIKNVQSRRNFDLVLCLPFKSYMGTFNPIKCYIPAFANTFLSPFSIYRFTFM